MSESQGGKSLYGALKYNADKEAFGVGQVLFTNEIGIGSSIGPEGRDAGPEGVGSSGPEGVGGSGPQHGDMAA